MPLARRMTRLAFLALIAVSPSLKGGLSIQRIWSLSEIADAPVLLVGRVVSLDPELGPHLWGNPKASASEQKMTAEVEVLRFFQRPAATDAVPGARLKIRFVGVDGPVFSFAPRDLPALEPGQVLLLPLRSKARESSDPWQLVGDEGHGLTLRVSASMEEPALVTNDPRAFIIREIVNSLSLGDPIAIFTAASLVARQAGYLEPELTTQLQSSIGSDSARWAQVLGNLLLNSQNVSLTVADVRAGKAERAEKTSEPAPLTEKAAKRARLQAEVWARGPNFKVLPLAQLALSNLPDAAHAETQVWQALLADVPAFADEPRYPLYSSPEALGYARSYLARYRDDPAFVDAVRTALREDRPGSLAIAGNMISEGQRACLPDALARAMKVISRPTAFDVFPAIVLVLTEGSDEQRRQYVAVAQEFKNTNPDYSAFLLMKLGQTPKP